MPVTRADRARQAIAGALLELVREGDPNPTAPRVAERAGVSLRLVFHHFRDMESVWAQVAARQLARLRERIAELPSERDPLERRIDALAASRARLYEEIAPVRRAALMREHSSPAIAASLRAARRHKRDQVAALFRPELAAMPSAERRDTRCAAQAIASWSTWDALRNQQRLTGPAARRVIARTLRTLFRAAIAVAAAITIATGAAACGGGTSVPPVEAWEPPPNPHLADSSWAIFHHDSYAQHWSPLPGVTGAETLTFDIVPLDGIPVFVLFDPDEDILTVAKGINGATLWKIDRETLTPIASADLTAAAGVFSATYGFVDAEGRTVLGSGRSILRYRSTAEALELEVELDLTTTLDAEDALVAISALYSGEIAFLSAQGVVGIVPPELSAPIATIDLDAKVSNGFSVDPDGGIYIVAGDGLYRVDWDGAALTERWREAVDSPFTTPRPGRLGIGSGTTPVLMLDDYVVIADDAERMNILVYRRGDLAAGESRLVCKLPAFDGPGATDNAIVVTGRTMIIEQNLQDEVGVARFDLLDDGTCARAWASDVHAPTCVPTLSTATGLVYVYSELDGEFALEGLDLDDGSSVFRIPTGGGLYNNYYSAVTVGPDARVYVGTLSGLLVFRE